MTSSGAFTCGFGTDSVIAVECDAVGRMDPAKLEAAVEAQVALGHVPLMVQATAGTTVYGYNMWLYGFYFFLLIFFGGFFVC